MGTVQTPDRLASINEKRPALNCCSRSQAPRKFTRANDLHSSGGRHKHARHQACALQWRDHLPVRDSQTERSEVFIEVPAIYTGQTFFMSHHLTKTDCATFILKDTQCAGLCREDCEINGDAFAANGIFQKNMSVYQTVASRLRCAGENRPIRLCGCRKREKEKDTFKTHELYGPPVLDAGCRLRMLPAAMLYHRISAAASENADRSVTDPKWDLLSGLNGDSARLAQQPVQDFNRRTVVAKHGVNFSHVGRNFRAAKGVFAFRKQFAGAPRPS